MRKRKDVKFKPTNDFLKKSVADYLKNGGRIIKIEIDEESYRNFVVIPETPGAVDEFLNEV